MTKGDFEVFKPWLVSHLKYGPVIVTFTKKDGTERVMNCTLNEELIPKVAESTPVSNLEEILKDMPKKERKVNEDILPVYDLDAKSWRSFRWDAVKNVQFSIGEEDV